MKKSIGSYEAKTNLSSILDKVAKGDTFTITKRGQPVAILSPINETSFEKINTAVEQIREMRKAFKLHGIKLKKIVSEGRK